MSSRTDHIPGHQSALVDENPAVPGEQQGFCVDPIADELASFLRLVDHDDRYRIEEVMKESDFEITQKVVFVSDSGEEEGPFVRKYMKRSYGLGGMYEEIYRAQQAGERFAHLPRIYECYHLKDDLVVVMEYVRGETLREVVYRCDPSVELAIGLFPLMVQAVRELHECFCPPIIHRDLKPSNIIVSFDRLTLIDFGIARSYRHGSEADTVRFGTREYAPPEQFGYGQTDVRSDVYALGMLLYYCLTESTADADVRARGFESPDVPEAFRTIIARACAFDPAMRFESARALLEAFQEACSSIDRDRVEPRLPIGGCMLATGSRGNAQGQGGGFSHHARSAGSVSKPVPLVGRLSLMGDRIHSACDKAPRVAGMLWNIVLLIVWALFVAAAYSAAFFPNEYDMQFPLWFRVLEYGGFAGITFTSWCYVFLDKRRFFKRFPRMKKTTFPVRFTVGAVAVPFVLLMVVVAAGQFVLPGGLFVP